MANTTDIIQLHLLLEEDILQLMEPLLFMKELILGHLLELTFFLSFLEPFYLPSLMELVDVQLLLILVHIKLCIAMFHLIFLFIHGDFVNQGDLIANVGPKNIYGFSNNYFKDASGNPTNGSTTGPHLHLNIKKNNVSLDPLSFF